MSVHALVYTWMVSPARLWAPGARLGWVSLPPATVSPGLDPITICADCIVCHWSSHFLKLMLLTVPLRVGTFVRHLQVR